MPSLAITNHTIMKTLTRMRRTPKGLTSKPLGIRLTPDEVAEVEQLATNEQRSRAWFLRYLILRGLSDYKHDLAAKPYP